MLVRTKYKQTNQAVHNSTDAQKANPCFSQSTAWGTSIMVFSSTLLSSLNWHKRRHHVRPLSRHSSTVMLAGMVLWLHLAAAAAEITAGTCSCIPAGEACCLPSKCSCCARPTAGT
jgi:hypothetical protein